MRRLIGDEQAPVHVLGGIADGVSDETAAAFVDAVRDSGAIGASLYDYATTPPNVAPILPDVGRPAGTAAVGAEPPGGGR
jgi:hypothetical protein